MRMVTIHLTDDQLLTLAKIALAPGGVVGDWGNAMEDAGITVRTAVYLGTQGFLESVERQAPGGAMPHLQVTEKGHRELMIRFIR